MILRKERSTFNETDTDELDAKIMLNSLLEAIPYYSTEVWTKIHSDLNKGIVGKEVASKDCYRIGAVQKLKEYAQRQNCLFAKDGAKLYIYNMQYWVVLNEELIKEFLHKVSSNMGVPYAYSADVKFIKSLYEQLLESGFYEKMTQSDITYLNLLNGTLKIDENGANLVDFSPQHFLTHQLDFEHDSSVINQTWIDFINMVIPDKDTQKTLQQSIGYLFIKGLKLELAFFLYGTGANGKSVIFEVIKGLLSADMMTNYSLASLTNKLGYQVADLNNKLINYASDISMKNVNPAIFKQLVSGEPIGTRQIREKAFTMKHYTKLIFNVNKLDDADIENTHGFYRRMVFIPFEITIPRESQDKNLHKKLLENKAGIMNWIIEGIEEVIIKEEISLSDKCENFLENFKKESSPIQLFIEDSGLTITAVADNEVIDFQQVYEMYREFCKKQGEKAIAQRSFNADLKRLGFERVRRKQGNVWFAKIN